MPDNTRINAGREFTDIARDLHAQFHEKGAKAGIRFDGRGLYVKNNSKFWDAHIGTNTQLKVRHAKFENAACLLKNAIDREYDGISIKGKSIGEHVLGNLLASAGGLRLDEKALTELEKRVQTAVADATAEALETGDQKAISLLTDFERVTTADLEHQIDLSSVQTNAGWRERVNGYRALRDALAEDLCAVVSSRPECDPSTETPTPALENGELLASEPDNLGLRAQADEILARHDVIHRGLTNATIEKVLNAVSDGYEDNDNYKGGNFKMVRGLYDKVRMNTCIDANTARLSDLNEEILGLVIGEEDGEWARHNNEQPTITSTIRENNMLVSQLKQHRLSGGLYDQDIADDMSQKLAANAAAMLKARDIYNQIPENSLINDVMVSTNKEKLNELVINQVSATFDISNSMLLSEDRSSPSTGSQNNQKLPMGDVSSSMDSFAAMFGRDTASEIGRALQTRLSEPQQLFVNGSSKADGNNKIVTYNENMARVWKLSQLFQQSPSAETLDKFGEGLDDAYDSYQGLNNYLKKTEQYQPPLRLVLDASDQKTLQKQEEGLYRASHLFVALKDGFLEAERAKVEPALSPSTGFGDRSDVPDRDRARSDTSDGSDLFDSREKFNARQRGPNIDANAGTVQVMPDPEISVDADDADQRQLDEDDIVVREMRKGLPLSDAETRIIKGLGVDASTEGGNETGSPQNSSSDLQSEAASTGRKRSDSNDSDIYGQAPEKSGGKPGNRTETDDDKPPKSDEPIQRFYV
ncbi:MAG: hypothetical protein AAF936_08645 [Pseudomonadota bacterium]